MYFIFLRWTDFDVFVGVRCLSRDRRDFVLNIVVEFSCRNLLSSVLSKCFISAKGCTRDRTGGLPNIQLLNYWVGWKNTPCTLLLWDLVRNHIS